MKEKISFIINPISGTRKKDAWPEIIRAHIDENRFEITICFTERQGHASELAQQQANDGIPYIVAVGGDGTVNEVASALRDGHSAMGIVPCGSGNGLARHLHIPLNLSEALKVINTVNTIDIDYGLANERPFFCTLGTGFDAHVSEIFSHSKKRGFRKYVTIIAKEFLTYRTQKYALKIDDHDLETKAMALTVANASQYGNNAYISPLSDICDGKLDVCIVRPFPKIFAFGLALRLISGTIHRSPFYRSCKAERITILRQNGQPVHLDGDPFEMDKEINIRIVRHGLKVIVK